MSGAEDSAIQTVLAMVNLEVPNMVHSAVDRIVGERLDNVERQVALIAHNQELLEVRCLKDSAITGANGTWYRGGRHATATQSAPPILETLAAAESSTSMENSWMSVDAASGVGASGAQIPSV